MDYGKAKARYVRVSPQKARLVAGLIRGKSVDDALEQLQLSPQKGARYLLKVLQSALANAESIYTVKRDELYVSELRVDEGPTWKRAKAGFKGSRTPILKRTSHLSVTLSSY